MQQMVWQWWLTFRKCSSFKQAAILCLPVAAFWLVWMAFGYDVPGCHRVLYSEGPHGTNKVYWQLPIPTSGWWLACVGLAWPLFFEPVIRYKERVRVTAYDDGYGLAVGGGWIVGFGSGIVGYIAAPACGILPVMVCLSSIFAAWPAVEQLTKKDFVNAWLIFCFMALGGLMAGPTFGAIITVLSVAGFLLCCLVVGVRWSYFWLLRRFTTNLQIVS